MQIETNFMGRYLDSVNAFKPIYSTKYCDVCLLQTIREGQPMLIGTFTLLVIGLKRGAMTY